ncbi:co-chaperone GroES [Natronospora cellulosivora (SeqCode)]
MKIKPLNKRVAIKFIEEDEKQTKSGIVLPDTAKAEKPQQGEVVAIAADCESLNVGDVVVYDKYAGNKVKVDDVEYVIVKSEDVLAIVE